MNEYNELIRKMKNGLLPAWKSITKNELEQLLIDYNVSNPMLAELYNVTVNQVRYKKRILGISNLDIIKAKDCKKFNITVDEYDDLKDKISNLSFDR